jgi:glutamate:GABA antiporter
MDKKPTKTGPKVLGAFSLVMITVGSVDSIRNLPTIALFGGSLIFFFILSTIFFLLPSTLIATELATTWPEEGGIYTWVKHAFGKRMGFAVIWLQWVGNVIWYPTILSFAAATLGYLISPELANNKIFLISVILSSFWGITTINLFGMRLSAVFSSICTITGLLLPMILIIGLGASWLLSGHPAQIDFSFSSILPNLGDPKMWVSLTGIIMSLCGMEIATIHAQSVKNPAHDFPIALLTSTLILLFTLIFGALAVAIVLPENQMSLVSGIIQTFQTFFYSYNLSWFMPIIAVILVIGSIGGVNNWIIAPTKGLHIATKDGHLPKHFSRSNKHNAPHALLIYQAIIVTLLMLVFFLMPSVNSSYWLLTVMTVQLYMLMYLILFASGIRLRFKYPEQHRPFKIPGKNHLGMLAVASAGILGTLTAFCIGFIPPNSIATGGIMHYESILIIGILLMSAPPFIINKFRYKFIKQLEDGVQ